MVLTSNTLAILMPESGYTSCIKINGKPILPPLITASRRLEIENYKKRAIEIESRLKSQKCLEITEPFKNNSCFYNKSLEHFLSFGSDNSHINALGIADVPKKSNQKLPSQDCKTVVPLKNQKFTNLTCNTFDVSEYSDNGVVIFNQCNEIDSNEQEKQLSASTVELDLSDAHSAGDSQNEVHGDFLLQVDDPNESFIDTLKRSRKEDFLSSTVVNTETLQELKPKPRLIRSNSYTLESPSPILLEHFQKQAEQHPNNSYAFEKYTAPQRRSLDLGNFKHDSVSCDYKSPRKIFTSQRGKYDVKGCDFISLDKNIGHLFQDLAQKHFGEVNEPSVTEIQDKDDTFSLNTRVEEAEAALQEVLNGMPENCAKDIIDFLERHKKEEEMKLKSYNTFREQLFDHNVNLVAVTQNISMDLPKAQTQYMEFDPLSPSPRDEGEKQSEIKSCTSEALANSPTDTVNALNTSTPLLIDFESDSCDNERSVHFEFNSTYSNSDPLHVLRGYDDYRRLADHENKSPNCSRELFPDNDVKIQRKLREQWAATVLTAAAKGYLVRRLKRTERVKNLIQTIQDALVCAMSLHTESTESIRPPDVELHRRLIQQVSAACFEFYEVFFNLTTKEQMTLIALDRERLKEKLKRPKSTSSLKLDSSSRSTPNSQRQSFNNIRQKKILTPSFAA